jgi:hypothetical protein
MKNFITLWFVTFTALCIVASIAESFITLTFAYPTMIGLRLAAFASFVIVATSYAWAHPA